jgi:hypothetical protein
MPPPDFYRNKRKPVSETLRQKPDSAAGNAVTNAEIQELVREVRGIGGGCPQVGRYRNRRRQEKIKMRGKDNPKQMRKLQ